MKRTILAVLITVMIATPCLAQEVEPDGMFSIDGTRWRLCQIYFQTNLRPIISFRCDQYLAFYRGSVYSCTSSGTCEINPFLLHYIDTPIVGVAWEVYAGCGSSFGSPPFCVVDYQVAVMQPFGLGVHNYMMIVPRALFVAYGIGIMFKVEDDWTPPEEE